MTWILCMKFSCTNYNLLRKTLGLLIENHNPFHMVLEFTEFYPSAILLDTVSLTFSRNTILASWTEKLRTFITSGP